MIYLALMLKLKEPTLIKEISAKKAQKVPHVAISIEDFAKKFNSQDLGNFVRGIVAELKPYTTDEEKLVIAAKTEYAEKTNIGAIQLKSESLEVLQGLISDNQICDCPNCTVGKQMEESVTHSPQNGTAIQGMQATVAIIDDLVDEETNQDQQVPWTATTTADGSLQTLRDIDLVEAKLALIERKSQALKNLVDTPVGSKFTNIRDSLIRQLEELI